MRGVSSRRIIRRMPNYDQEDSVVDFNDASLYLPLAQTVFSICASGGKRPLVLDLAPRRSLCGAYARAL